MNENPNKKSRRGNTDPRLDPEVTIPKCPRCFKDALSCDCGGLEDIKK